MISPTTSDLETKIWGVSQPNKRVTLKSRVINKADRIWESILRRIDSASIWLKNVIESIL